MRSLHKGKEKLKKKKKTNIAAFHEKVIPFLFHFTSFIFIGMQEMISYCPQVN